MHKTSFFTFFTDRPSFAKLFPKVSVVQLLYNEQTGFPPSPNIFPLRLTVFPNTCISIFWFTSNGMSNFYLFFSLQVILIKSCSAPSLLSCSLITCLPFYPATEGIIICILLANRIILIFYPSSKLRHYTAQNM